MTRRLTILRAELQTLDTATAAGCPITPDTPLDAALCSLWRAMHSPATRARLVREIEEVERVIGGDLLAVAE